MADNLPHPLDMSAMESVCRETAQGWLWVDVEMLRVRCDWNSLDPAERAEIERRRLEAQDWGAA